MSKNYSNPWLEGRIKVAFYNNNLPVGKRRLACFGSLKKDDLKNNDTRTMNAMHKRLIQNPNTTVKERTQGWTQATFFQNKGAGNNDPVLRRYSPGGIMIG